MLAFPNITVSILFSVARVDVTIFLFFAVVGWIGNSLIILVTVKSKNLRAPCNILIAMQSFSDIVWQLSHLPYAYFAFSETLVSFYTCFFVNFVFISGVDVSTVLMFFIALDRFVAAKNPHFYSTFNKRNYVVAIVALSLLYAAVFKALLYTSLTEDPTLCLIAESMTGTMTNLWFGVSTVVNLSVIGLYCALTRMIKVSFSEYQRINRSINMIILVYVFGWLATMGGCFFALRVGLNHWEYTAIETTVGIFCNVNVAAPFFIYFFRSTAYRQEFSKLFKIRRKARSVIGPQRTAVESSFWTAALPNAPLGL